MIFTNALVVAPTESFSGTVVLSDGVIKEVGRGRSSLPAAMDLNGDYLLPGLIELHTDNLEHFLMPRPKVHWPSYLTALLAHDSLVTAAGITTVLDSVFLGSCDPVSPRPKMIEASLQAIRQGDDLGMTRAQHFLHLRCELPDEDLLPLFEKYYRNSNLKLVSLNDHTPGQRQWRDMASFRSYYRADHMSEEKISLVIERQLEMQDKYLTANRLRVLELCREIGITLASHDDTTEEHIVEAAAAGVTISEFPTTFKAATKGREMGLKTICGGPNLVRGGSHSANVSARELAEANLLDAISSDYYPAGLLEAVFVLHHELAYSLDRAVATVTSTPADMVGLTDRGRIEPGLKADLIQVKVRDGLPLILHVWQGGSQKY